MKNRFLRTCLCIALCLALFSGVFLVMGWGNLLGQVGSTILYPFQWVSYKVADGVAGFCQYFTDIHRLTEEVESLRQENEHLQAALQDAEIVREEYSWLYGYLSMKEEHTSYQLCAATVTARVMSGAYPVELTLNKGRAHGITEGMPVVTVKGLVGVVYQVGQTYCKVRTILNTSASVGACVVRSGEMGMCEGDFTALTEGKIQLRYLAAEADVSVDDSVVTGGRGSVYPYGIPVGRVTGISFNAFSRTTEAEIQPFADMTDIDQVMILTGYDRYAEGYAPGEGSG